jgi:hypothetical protein
VKGRSPVEVVVSPFQDTEGFLASGLQLVYEKGIPMPILKTIGAIIVILIVLWVVFAIIHVLTAIIGSVLGLLIVIAICYGLYHHFTHRPRSR